MRPAATRKLIAASRGDEFSPNGTSIGDEREKEPGMTDHLIARSRTTIVLVAGAVAAWAVTVDRMRGMDASPGTDLGGLGWYLGIWVTMTAAMMLPSAAPTARHVGRLAHRVPTLLFTGGYLAVWTGYGLLAYGVFRLVTSFDIGWLASSRAAATSSPGSGRSCSGLRSRRSTPSKRRTGRRRWPTSLTGARCGAWRRARLVPGWLPFRRAVEQLPGRAQSVELG